MIKRMNKVTALMVAAAAVISLVPATTASAAEKLMTKEGTIEKALPFADGKYLYEGYKTEDDDLALYLNDGSKDKVLSDYEDATIGRLYGTKYVTIQDGSDEYLLDLSTGKVSDDETIEDKEATLSVGLRTILRKTDKYSDIANDGIGLNRITTDQFSDVWYEYTTTGQAKLDAAINNDQDYIVNGYTNESKKYIDTTVTANLYVYDSGKTVKIEKYGSDNTYGTNSCYAELTGMQTLTQDSDYIYTLTTVDVTTGASATQTTTTKKYIQKISKAQGDTDDKAYLPKSVTSYEVTDLTDNSDASDAETLINTVPTGATRSYRVINGVLYVTDATKTDVTVTTIKLKKDKVTVKATNNTTKSDLYLAEKSDSDTQSIEGSTAVSIDVDGNTWAVNKGTIYKFDTDEFKSVYTCDRTFNVLEVYNSNSLVAWDDVENDVYTTVQEGKQEVTTTPVQTGWVKTDAGWTFYDTLGKQVTGKWVNDAGVWYMIKADGVMATGWYNDNGTWYYLNASGAMKTGWLNDNGTWYYLKSSGAMATGWLNDNGTWYFLNASGAMLANTTVDGYKLGANGAWVK